MMNRRAFIGTVAVGVLVLSSRADAQRAKKLPRVAIVFIYTPMAELAGAEPAFPMARALVHALRDVGLVEGQTVTIERRSTEGHLDRMDELMQELIALDVDVIVTVGPGVRAAQRATDRIPIVGLVDGALDAGLVDSLARPGRNLTGFGDNSPGAAKQLQLLKEAAPTISRVAIIASSSPPGRRVAWRDEIDAAASSMQLDLRWIAVDTPEGFEPAFAMIVGERANALFVMNSAVNFRELRRIADFAIKRQLPSVCAWREFADAGGLLSYGSANTDTWLQAAAYVKKILDGAKPGDLPFVQPTTFDLTINQRTARTLGLTIPQSLLLRAGPDGLIQ